MSSMMDHELAPEHVAQTEDVTLGMTALLGIFFAVVLVCALFFGFGYSTGRTLHGTGSALPTGATTPQTGLAPGADQPQASTQPALASVPPPAPKPAAGTPALQEAPAEPSAAQSARETAGQTAGQTASHAASEASGESEAWPPEQPAATAAPVPGPRAATATLRSVHASAEPLAAAPSVTPSATGGIMVQIAAVARPGDAQALARALRKNGYSAAVRTEPQDALLHVQVGPFATREAARAMRAHLQADGYNAFIKP